MSNARRAIKAVVEGADPKEALSEAKGESAESRINAAVESDYQQFLDEVYDSIGDWCNAGPVQFTDEEIDARKDEKLFDKMVQKVKKELGKPRK